MITIVLTYRDRDLGIVEKCLESLNNQSLNDFKVILVDYGSQNKFSEALKNCIRKYPFIKLIYCPVEGQLWNKSRAINLALRQCETPYFLVGDIDLIFHPDFVKIASNLGSENVWYFKYSFLSKEESLEVKEFSEYEIEFEGNKEVTGTTLFPTDKLKAVNGYDEFYHGWGAEDTDIHMRLKASGMNINFYEEQQLIKHQWHRKAYRSKNSTSPFHSNLERVNQNYMLFTINNKIFKANINDDWGTLPNIEDYLKLSEKPDVIVNINPADFHLSALLAQFKNFDSQLLQLEIKEASLKNKFKEGLKKGLKKKYINYLNLEIINNLLLEEIIKNYRNKPYKYKFNREKGVINFSIYFN